MNATALALSGYIAWFLLLLGGIAVLRTVLTVSGKKLANSFKPDGSDVSPFSARLCGAHANAYESFPFIGGILLLALVADSTGITDPLALWLLVARVLQSTTHIISTSIRAVQVRFLFFLIQYVIAIYWTVHLLARFAG